MKEDWEPALSFVTFGIQVGKRLCPIQQEEIQQEEKTWIDVTLVLCWRCQERG